MRKCKEYWYYSGSTRQASDYENTTVFIIKTLKQRNDIAKEI